MLRSSRGSPPAIHLALALLVSALAASCGQAEPGASREAIVGGAIETGYPSVYLMSTGGGTCTATLISPRVVLTARHCVWNEGTGTVIAARTMRLYVGWDDRRLTGEYRVSRVEIIPGSTSDLQDGNAWDIALLVLASPAAETPIDIARDFAAGGLLGTDAVVVGWGQTPGGGAGTKYRGVAHIVDLQNGLILSDPSICQGDSGGPLIGADGLIYGVASFGFGTELTCGVAMGAHNEVFRHVAWIDSVLESVGDVCIPDPELCDGLDNDCNGTIDDPCLALGDACTTSEECGSGLCEDFGGGPVCTQSCDPTQGALGCGLGMYCVVTGCAGRCAPGTLGAGAVGSTCTGDLDCASGFCRDPGDGRSLCLAPCARDRAQCLAAEVCVPLSGTTCGGCVDSAIVSGSRALGEPCSAASECSSGQCVVRAGLGECAGPCGAGASCGEGFVCHDALCVVDRRQPIGGACIENADCQTGLCAALGAAHWCTSLCTSDAGCPASFRCDAEARVCAPDLGLDGAACAVNADCVSNLCATSGGGGTCVSFCDAELRCAVGFECRRAGDGTTSVCTRPPSHAGGCAAGPSRGAGPGVVALGGLALLLFCLRRRPHVRRARRVDGRGVFHDAEGHPC